ncbi:hypothetical protein [Herbidospora cretacea]|uniref:hypothetical protein n=1 Tax=Herbidospora cretacea TaxID=28444 RepID=UPI00068B0804|nr:hypothetical protein [Herbidospora cretacea]
MKPVYQTKVWQEGDWWLARVMSASDGADQAPLNALTQARTLSRIDQMSRDLIATILDADEDDFDIEPFYELPDDLGDLLCEAKGARAWLEAAQDLWSERASITAQALADKGYSLRETATLLGLSHQRVDQLLQTRRTPEAGAPTGEGKIFALNAHRREYQAWLVLRTHVTPPTSRSAQELLQRVRQLLDELDRCADATDPERCRQARRPARK